MPTGTHRPEFRAWTGGSPPPKKLPAEVKKLADELYREQITDWREGWGDEPDKDTQELFRKRARYDAWATYRHKYEENPKMARKENRSCPPGQIRRKGYTRKGYTRKDGTRVAPSRVPAACIEDQGEPGKGPKVFTIEDEGDLGGPGYTDKPTKERQRLMRACVKRKGYRSCLGKLQALAILGKNTWSKKKLAVVERDRKWLVKTFGGPGSFGPEKNPKVPGALQEPGMSEAELMARLKF